MNNERYFVYVGCSKWTNSNRPMAKHIATETGQPLCGKTYKNGALDRYPLRLQEISCTKCFNKFKKLNQPYSLYLDDERNPKTERNWIIARNLKEFVKTIEDLGIPAYISFDHDLGEGEPTGYDCAKWLVNGGIVIKEFNVHSANIPGKENIEGLLNNWIDFCFNQGNSD